MEWNVIVQAMPALIERVRTNYVLGNAVIRDDVFKILESHCTVIYYPIENEENRGFHIKRYLNGESVDFVYINTAQSVPTQIFTAAHELGHVWQVRKQLSEIIGQDIPIEMEEKVVNRFAAELLMPAEQFKKTFWKHYYDIKLDKSSLYRNEMIKILVMQMDDYMVTYESVRRRLIEVGIINNATADTLYNEDARFDDIIKAYSNDINTVLDSKTLKKTIPGIREMLECAESNNSLDECLIKQIKKDFDISSIHPTDEIINLELKGD